MQDEIITLVCEPRIRPVQYLYGNGAYRLRVSLNWYADAPQIVRADESSDGVTWHPVDPARIRFTLPRPARP